MISYRYVKLFCKDDISLIENYEEAINSPEIWHCHHRLETDLNLSVQELKDSDLYFNRPASELIFLTHSEHARLHNTGAIRSEETRKKQSDSNKGENNPMYGKTPWTKGKPGTTKNKHRVYHEDGTWHME